jgi:beta-glucanase (GH16 family)
LVLVALLVAALPAAAQGAPPPVTLERLIEDFNDGLWFGQDASGNSIGIAPWGDTPENVTLSTRLLIPHSALALPVAVDVPNTVLAVAYDIDGWGGFTHTFTDGERWLGQDWAAHNAFSFWLYGNGTGGAVLVELYNSRDDATERLFYQIVDDYQGWRQFTIPFDLFQRRGAGDAPDTGLRLDDVFGYSFSFPAGVGAQVAFVDDVGLATLLDVSSVVVVGGDAAQRVLPASTSDAPGAWMLAWSDEFEGPAGTPINSVDWTCDTGGHGWGNDELQYYTARLDNVSLDGDGNLAIVARAANPAGYQCHYGECLYTSARCTTLDKVEFMYGRVEARVKLPAGQGMWPAFWMLGADILDVGWPASGEIDIVEMVGKEPRNVYGGIHGTGFAGGENGFIGFQTNVEGFADDFHVFAVEWFPDVIRWYVDDELFHTATPGDISPNAWLFDHEFYLLLNLAVGGSWPGPPDETTVFPQTMLVDYIRVYQRAADE